MSLRTSLHTRVIASAVAALLLLALPADLAAQSGARLIVEISPALLEPAEEEPIVCTRRRAQESFQIQNQPMGRFAARTGAFNTVIWAVTLVNSGRSLVLEVESGYRPREVTINGTRPRAAGGWQENVRVRFLNDGATQDGQRAVTAPASPGAAAAPATSPLDSLDGPRLYLLARELAFRCERDIVTPVPIGSIQGQIPPR